MLTPILITRPEPAASQFADQLRGRFGSDLKIVISPVMQIAYLQEALTLEGINALIFTSRNGVEGFARVSTTRDIPCYAVGPSTAERARQDSLQVIDVGGDSAALTARMIKDDVKGPALHLRGQHTTGDIATKLTAAGIETHEKVLYRQEPAPLSPEARELLDRESPVILPLFSPRSADILFADIRPNAPLFVAAISEKVAIRVPKDQAVRVIVANRPDGDSMLDAIDKLREDAKQLEGAYRAQ